MLSHACTIPGKPSANETSSLLEHMLACLSIVSLDWLKITCTNTKQCRSKDCSLQIISNDQCNVTDMTAKDTLVYNDQNTMEGLSFRRFGMVDTDQQHGTSCHGFSDIAGW